MNEPFVLSELQEKEIIYSIYEFFLWRRDQEKEKEKQSDNNNKGKSSNITNNCDSSSSTEQQEQQQEIPLKTNNNNNKNNNTPAYIKYQSVLDNLRNQFSKYESDFSSKEISEGFPSLIVKTLLINLSNNITNQLLTHQSINNNNNNQTAVMYPAPMYFGFPSTINPLLQMQNIQQAPFTTEGVVAIQNNHPTNLKRQRENNQESPNQVKKKSHLVITLPTDNANTITKQSNTTTTTVCDNTKNYKINYLKDSEGKILTSSEIITKPKQSNNSAQNNKKNNSVQQITGKSSTLLENSTRLQSTATSIKEKPITTWTKTTPATIINPYNSKHVDDASTPHFYEKKEFDERYNEVVHYKALNGHTRVPVQKTELGRWVAKIRVKKRQMDKGEFCAFPLSDEQIKKLDSIGFVWNASSAPEDENSVAMLEREKFDERFKELVQFKALNGHVRVPIQKTALGYWVSRIRAKKREIDLGRPCPNLSQEQINRLDSIGFEWNVFVAKNCITFEQRLEALTKYKKVNGHCDVPNSYKGDSSLGDWVKDTRKKYRKKALSLGRIKKLENLGFRWVVGPTPKSFEERLAELIKFKERHGHCDLSGRNYKDDPVMVGWVQNLRLQYRNKTLTEERVKMLEDIGFNWVAPPATKTFEDWLEECCDYRQKHGHLKIPPVNKACQSDDEFIFSRWANLQRNQYRKWKAGKKSKMNESRFNKLNEIGFDWPHVEEVSLQEDKKNVHFDERLQQLRELKEKVGSCSSLQDFVKGGYTYQSPLYRWAKTQRLYWRDSKLSKEKVKKLKELNFDLEACGHLSSRGSGISRSEKKSNQQQSREGENDTQCKESSTGDSNINDYDETWDEDLDKETALDEEAALDDEEFAHFENGDQNGDKKEDSQRQNVPKTYLV